MFRFVFALLIITALTYAQIAQSGNKGLLRTQSAQTLGRGVLGISTAGYFSLDNDFIIKGLILDDSAKTASFATGIKPTYVSTYYSICYGLLNFWDVNVTVPFYVDNTNIGDKGRDNGIGDVAISMKFQYPPYEHSHVFDMTYFGEMTIPTAKANQGIIPRDPSFTRAQNVKPGTRYLTDPLFSNFEFLDTAHSDADRYKIFKNDSDKIPDESNYYGAGNITFTTKMLWTLDASEINPDVNIKWHTNFGALFNSGKDHDNLFVLGSALEWTPHPLFTLFTDFYGKARFAQLSAGFDLGKEPLILGSGVSCNIPGGAHLTVAFDKSFSLEKYKTLFYNPAKNQAFQTKVFPNFGISVSVNWNGSIMGGDRDNDGIPDKIDQCPDDPEDVDGFEDYDGCPDPDNDHDGITDIRDKCPNKAEDMDNFLDEDGCPDLDNDKDGIPDALDKCSNDPEDHDGFEDRDGCPDYDNDKDGIADSLDRCAIDPEDIDGFDDKDGCPDTDNDKDAIPDSLDKCPNQAENINGFQDQDGCSDVKAKEIETKMVLEGVNFKSASTELTYESGAVLDKVIESMVAYPEVCIEIRGHTDNVGQRAANVELSLGRAESVKAYMVTKGVDAKRIITAGKGPDEPIATNNKADGRAKNRRIEMYRTPCR